MSENTIIGLFNARVHELRDRAALCTQDDTGVWQATSWTDYGRNVRALARALMDLGVGKGDGVAVLSYNRAEYHVIDLATLVTGATAVPVYHTNSPPQVEYVLDHSDAKVVFVENGEQRAKVDEVRDKLPKLEKVITIEDGGGDATYEELVSRGAELDASDTAVYDSACDAITPEDLACLIYTSGTTGPPKGAMLTHDNIVWTCGSLSQVLRPPTMRTLSFLPLAHIAERMVSHYMMISRGGETWFSSVPTLRDDLGACRPTVFFAVPRLYEKFQVALEGRFAEMTGLQGKLVNAAVEMGHRVVEARQTGARPGFLDGLLHPVLDRVVLSKVRHQLGLDEVTALVSGAAPITRETLVFFHAIGLPVAEVYGQTEDTGPTSLNPPEKIKIGTVGPPIPGCDVKIAEDGEILVRGGNVFAGYFKNPEATAETVVDGWLHSGDVGEFDEDGYLRITDRKKDLIITAGGKNISPSEIESKLKADKYISQSVVIGDARKFVSALITLDEDVVGPWAKDKDLPDDLAALSQTPEVRALVQKAVDRVNSTLSHVESIKEFTILPHDFSQDAGEVTPTLKVRRRQIADNYGDEIEAMYT